VHYKAILKNVVAQIAGDLLGVTNNNDYDLGTIQIQHTNKLVGKKMVGDLLEEKGYTWKSYQEAYPGGCFLGTQRPYYRKHNGFMSFTQVTSNTTYCAEHIVDSSQLYKDLGANRLPNFIYYTPDINNDAHDTGLDYADKWMYDFLCPLLSNSTFMNGTLVVVTFDEDDSLNNNNVYTVLIGSMAPVTVDNTWYNHYSLLRTIEDNFGLGTLGRNDDKATSFKLTTNKYYHSCNGSNSFPCIHCDAYDYTFLAGLIAGSIIGGIAAILIFVALVTACIFGCFYIAKKHRQEKLHAQERETLVV
jgi:hypothetical protein